MGRRAFLAKGVTMAGAVMLVGFPFARPFGTQHAYKTRDVMLLLGQDKPLKEIRKYADLKYSRYGPPTPTPPVP